MFWKKKKKMKTSSVCFLYFISSENLKLIASCTNWKLAVMQVEELHVKKFFNGAYVPKSNPGMYRFAYRRWDGQFCRTLLVHKIQYQPNSSMDMIAVIVPVLLFHHQNLHDMYRCLFDPRHIAANSSMWPYTYYKNCCIDPETPLSHPPSVSDYSMRLFFFFCKIWIIHKFYMFFAASKSGKMVLTCFGLTPASNYQCNIIINHIF